MNRVFVCLGFLLLLSCKPTPPEVTTFTGNAMTIDFKILIGDAIDASQTALIKQTIVNTFRTVDEIFNRWNPNSELSRLNSLPAYVSVPLSPPLEKLLKETDEMVRITRGKFDPTIEPLLQLWKKTLAKGRRPDQKDIQALLPAIGWHHIHVQNGLFYKDSDQTALDLGGIAKGTCVDLLIENLSMLGLKNIYAEWGGEIRVQGRHPEGRPWTIYVSRFGDENPANALAILQMRDQAIATSGDYLQNWTVHDPLLGLKTTYFHILDPSTGYPLISTPDSIACASVVAPSCAFADGLATAAMMFPTKEEAQQWADFIHQLYPEVSLLISSLDRTGGRTGAGNFFDLGTNGPAFLPSGIGTREPGIGTQRGVTQSRDPIQGMRERFSRLRDPPFGSDERVFRSREQLIRSRDPSQGIREPSFINRDRN